MEGARRLRSRRTHEGAPDTAPALTGGGTKEAAPAQPPPARGDAAPTHTGDKASASPGGRERGREGPRGKEGREKERAGEGPRKARGARERGAGEGPKRKR